METRSSPATATLAVALERCLMLFPAIPAPPRETIYPSLADLREHVSKRHPKRGKHPRQQAQHHGHQHLRKKQLTKTKPVVILRKNP